MLSSIRKSYVRFQMRIYSKSNICFHIYSSPILLSVTSYLYVYQLYLLVRLVKVLCVSLLVSLFFVHLSASVWPFIVTEKSDCDKINFVLVMISIITILVKLLEIILSRVTSFVVYWFFCHFVCVFEWSVFYILIRFFL